MDNLMIRNEDLLTNPTPRVPVCLCLDTSGSMSAVEGDCVQTGKTVYRDGKKWNLVTGGTSRIEELQRGVEEFYKAVLDDEMAKYSVEICIVTFDDDAKCVVDFSSVERQSEPPTLTLKDNTHMGEGVNLALDLLEARKDEYKKIGIDYYQPWLVLMTDGQPNGDSDELAKAIERTTDLINQRKLTIFPIGIGDGADMEILNRFSPTTPAMKLQGLKFQEFFAWLSQSVSATLQSIPGELIELDINSPDVKKWRF